MMRRVARLLGLVLAGCLLIRLASDLITPALPLLAMSFSLAAIAVVFVGRRGDL